MNQNRFRAATNPALIRISLGAVVAFALGNAPARAMGTLDYDPTKCKTDAGGKFYVAIGWNVLAMPLPGKAIMIDTSRLKHREPPDSSDQEGCPGNPLQTLSYGLPFTYLPEGSAAPRDPTKPMIGAWGLELIDLYFGEIETKPITTEWNAERVDRLQFDDFCAKSTIVEELSNGFTACRLQWRKSQTRTEDWMALYKSHVESYATPLGHPFMMLCGGDMLTERIEHCNVRYAVTPNLGLVYHFHPYLGPIRLPLDHVTDYDRALRTAIESYIVKDYVWPDFHSGNAVQNAGQKP